MSSFTPGPPVGLRGVAVVHLPDGGAEEAEIDLLAGRDRYSVGGQIAEGPRWWRGRLQCTNRDVQLSPGAELQIELGDGRSGAVVVEETLAAGAHVAAVTGVGPPPFRVP